MSEPIQGRPGDFQVAGGIPGPVSPEQKAPSPKRRLKVDPEPGGQLEQFLIANKEAHDKAQAAGEQEAETKLAIKMFLLSLFPDQKDIPDAFDIAADPHGRYPGYTMTLKTGFRLDTEKFKAEQTGMYVHYAKPVNPTWELRESSSGRRRRG